MLVCFYFSFSFGGAKDGCYSIQKHNPKTIHLPTLVWLYCSHYNTELGGDSHMLRIIKYKCSGMSVPGVGVQRATQAKSN